MIDKLEYELKTNAQEQSNTIIRLTKILKLIYHSDKILNLAQKAFNVLKKSLIRLEI